MISVESVVAAAAKLEVCDDDDGGIVAVCIQDRSSIGKKTRFTDSPCTSKSLAGVPWIKNFVKTPFSG